MTNDRKSGLIRILPLYFVIFIGFFGYSLMITIFTPLILDNSGGILDSLHFRVDRSIVLGVMLMLYPLGQFLGSPVLGAMSDRFGRRPILLVSLFVIAVCYALFALSLQMSNLPAVMVISIIMGLADADIVTAQSAIADVSTQENRSRLFGYIYLSASSAYVAGPLVGGKLADPSIVPWFDYATPYWAVFILLIFAFASTYLVFRETRVSGEGSKTGYFEAFTNMLSIFSAGRIRIIYLVNFLIYFSIFGFFRSYPMYLVDRYHMGVGRVSDFIAWVAVPIVFANLWLTGYLAKQFPPRRITVYSTLLFGILTFVIILPSYEGVLWVTLFLPGLALAVALPACASMLSLMVSADEQGGVLGNNQSLQVGAEALSGFAAGLLAALVIELPLIALAGVAVFASVLLAVEGRE
ncbi:MAG: MFS transporter, partial [Candidatus Dadabacteria bacterium]|nr:MFS transporter [Candidatus Dadabacteria bacterium]